MSAERYWEERWATEKAENDRLQAAVLEAAGEIRRLLRVCKDKTVLLKDAYAGNERRDAEIERLGALVQCLLDNDPNDDAADGGITVLDVWRRDARAVLKRLN
jgi:hypothetical protein